MTLTTKRLVIAGLAAVFLLSLVFVQAVEVTRRRAEVGLAPAHVVVPEASQACVDCHAQQSAGIVEHWKGSTHAEKGVGCYDCHKAERGEADAFEHEGKTIATIVTPKDCGRCHGQVTEEFGRSHHANGGNILASLDNRLAEIVEGARLPFDPHSPTPGRKDRAAVVGLASVNSGCKQCHGSKVALVTEATPLTVDDLKPGPDGKPSATDALARIKKDERGRPVIDPTTWPNTGIGRINLDGSLGSCTACHSRHDFSARRARRPENCGKCHLGPDHPQKEIYDESKHGVAFRDLELKLNLDGRTWVLGKDYAGAPTCATCHMSGHSRNGGKVTHDPGERISWTNRPPISMVMDTDKDHAVVKETDPAKRAGLIADSWEQKRDRMRQVCTHCHAEGYVNGFYRQYDDLVVLYNEKFAKPGAKLMAELGKQGLLTKPEFDEKIEWTWFYLWHHEGRRARHGAAMMAPDYTHWHGMYEVADRFYMELVPEAEEIVRAADAAGKKAEAEAVRVVLKDILARPEHAWFMAEKGKREARPASSANAPH
ncbi:MAG: hydroxylamine oxidoreductase [Deltaproteobacteria bacterium]|nr:hydroxylamine oxidoreductase [Deltaproteobacteria bacterium]